MLFVVAFVASACGGTGGSTSTQLTGTLNVFAAASLTDSFKALGASFQQAQTGLTVKFNFAGTPTLVTQIEQGADADVFAAAWSLTTRVTMPSKRLRADSLTTGGGLERGCAAM